jgi:hypothetical protein
LKVGILDGVNGVLGLALAPNCAGPSTSSNSNDLVPAWPHESNEDTAISIPRFCTKTSDLLPTSDDRPVIETDLNIQVRFERAWNRAVAPFEAALALAIFRARRPVVRR